MKNGMVRGARDDGNWTMGGDGELVRFAEEGRWASPTAVGTVTVVVQ